MYDSKMIITRGVYRHHQRNHFVSAREYVFIRKDGNKCLIVRYKNDIGATINSIEFFLKQIDNDGNVIETTRIKQSGLRVAPGRAFSPKQAIIVKEGCVDFRIDIIKAMSGAYSYSLKNDNLVVDFGSTNVYNVPHREHSSDFVVRPRRNYKPGRRTGWALVLVFLGCAIAVGISLCRQLYEEGFDFWGLIPQAESEEVGLDSDD